MRKRGIKVDHPNIYRWLLKFTSQLGASFREGKKRQVGESRRMVETYTKIKWKHRYRAIDKNGQTMDFLLGSATYVMPLVFWFGYSGR